MNIKDFEGSVLYNILIGNFTPKITDENGETPVIACLDSEPLGMLFERIEKCGGYATIYSLTDTGAVRVVGVLPKRSALTQDSASLVKEPPSPEASIGVFLDFVALQGSVETSNKLPMAKVTSYGSTELLVA